MRLFERGRVLIGLASLLAVSSAFSDRSRLEADDAFIRGDINSDGRISISDTLMLRRWLFLGGFPPSCMDAADLDDDGRAWLSDAINVLAVLFPSEVFHCSAVGEDGTVRNSVCGPIAEPTDVLGEDPTPDSLGCASWVPEPAAETADTVRLGSLRGVPGTTVRVPVYVSNSIAVEALQLVVAYDPALFQPLPSHAAGLRANPSPSFEGTIYEELYSRDPQDLSSFFNMVEVGVEPGVFTVGIIGHLVFEGYEIPPGDETLVAWIHGTIPADAPVGAEVTLDLVNDPISWFGMRSEFTHRGEARYVSSVPQLIDAVLQIVPDVAFFVRGDANTDFKVDVSDAIFTLEYLFLAGPAPQCSDAADADDSGSIVISDAVVILNHLFAGSSIRISDPYPLLGADPTPDDALGDCPSQP
jgi:hypothetical protein